MILSKRPIGLLISILSYRPLNLFVAPFTPRYYSAELKRWRAQSFYSYKKENTRHTDTLSSPSKKSTTSKTSSIRNEHGKRKNKFDNHNTRQSSLVTNHNKHSHTPNSNNNPTSRTQSLLLQLPDPSIIFSNNHLLIVNKPAGYHCQPNEAPNTSSISSSSSSPLKCLLTKLKTSHLGGGSQHDFLLPMHRLDQPCTGITLLAKNSKAGTRIGKAFRDKLIQKEYLCVVSGSLETMIQHSHILNDNHNNNNNNNDDHNEDDDDNIEQQQQQQQRKISQNNVTFYRLSGSMVLKNNKNQKEGTSPSVSFQPIIQGRSPVQTTSWTTNSDRTTGRICHLDWTYLTTLSTRATMNNDSLSFKDKQHSIHLILVRTQTGAKHQIRAMMAQLAKCPICGDLRYGAVEPLLDQSVALHARSLRIPSERVSLGETDFSRPFVASIPTVWNEYFSLTEKDVQRLLRSL